MTRIILTAFLVAAGSSLAAAQSSIATTGTTRPVQSAPPSADPQNAEQRKPAPPAARSGEKGLRVGEGAVTGEPIEIKRRR